MEEVSGDSWIEEAPVTDILLTAPPGCGKTDQLARRAAALGRSNVIGSHRQILALTFSHKAKANLRARLERELGRSFGERIAVMTFHGLGFRLLRYHGPLAGRDNSRLQGPHRGSLRQLRRRIADEHSIKLDHLESVIRWAKGGLYTDEEVLQRLESRGPAGLAYETELQASGRVDYDDAIRLGLLIMANAQILHQYRERFACLLVDEVQDLTTAQYDLIAGLGADRTVFAGDRAQGIYGFAGAAPAEVYAAIEARSTMHVRLTESYRSAAKVLRVDSAISKGLGGGPVTVARDAEWTTQGHVAVHRFEDPASEAAWVVDHVRRWMAEDPQASVGVMVRAKHRRETLDEVVADAGIVAEMWDFPAHRPSVVELLGRFVSTAVRTAGEGVDGVDELFARCAEAVADDQVDLLDELSEVADALSELVQENSLSRVVAGIRVASDPESPARPGLHLLNGHVGKGQQFDRVIILGLEEGHIPYYRAKTNEERKEELAVLHVMASRARSVLLFTCCRNVPFKGEDWIRKPSPWLKRLETLATEDEAEPSEA